MNADEPGTLSLLKAINATIDEPVDQAHIDEMLELAWPRYAERLAQVAKNATPTPKLTPRPIDDVLAEVLGVVRGMDHKLGTLSALTPGTGATQVALPSPSLTTGAERLNTAIAGLTESTAKAAERVRTLVDENDALKTELRNAKAAELVRAKDATESSKMS